MTKVSIITPVYNGERFIKKYIESVLNFTYKNLELILINDGSTDKTDKIITENKQKLIDSGIEFKYIKLAQNRGAANALNLGLKEISGEYLSWHDVDDIYYPECISKCLEVCLNNPEYKIVFSKFDICREEEPDKIISQRPKKNFKHKNIFADYILEKNVIYGPMRFVETKALFSVLQNKTIYVSNGGQNWQMILPMVYFYQWKYIDEPLSRFVIHQDSHSHSAAYGQYFKMHEEILINTIERMQIPKNKKNFYQSITKIKYLKKRLNKLCKISINLKNKTIRCLFFGKELNWRFND